MTDNITFKNINADALPDIIECYRALRPGWTPRIDTEKQLNDNPSIGAYNADGALMGFVYTYYFAPDIAELANMFVADEYRGQGIGRALLSKLEDAVAQTQYSALLLFNSSAYKTVSIKKPAADFYLKHGYQKISETEQTKIFIKHL